MNNPTDPGNAVGHGRTNYRGYGGSETGWILSGSVVNIAASPEHNNGIFVTNQVVKIADVIDGTSNTAILSEALLGDGDQTRISIPGDYFQVPYGPRTRPQQTAVALRRLPGTGSNSRHATVVLCGTVLVCRQLRSGSVQPHQHSE